MLSAADALQESATEEIFLLLGDEDGRHVNFWCGWWGREGERMWIKGDGDEEEEEEKGDDVIHFPPLAGPFASFVAVLRDVWKENHIFLHSLL